MERSLRQRPLRRWLALRHLLLLGGVAVLVALLAAGLLWPPSTLWGRTLWGQVDPWIFATYVVVGFIAQLIDGSLGMAYGLSSTSFLMSVGVSPALASASVHAAEVCTTAASGISHWRFGNVDTQLFRKLALPGALGAMIGAWLLGSVNSDMIKPFVATYLLFMGAIVLKRAIGSRPAANKQRRVGLLALVGGFVDSAGGGGWGSVVNSTLMAQGGIPRFTIGTVNAVEFIVSVAATGVFVFFVGLSAPIITLGLVVGGVLAAPFGALLIRHIPHRAALIMVGLLIIGLSLNNLIRYFSA